MLLIQRGLTHRLEVPTLNLGDLVLDCVQDAFSRKRKPNLHANATGTDSGLSWQKKIRSDMQNLQEKP